MRLTTKGRYAVTAMLDLTSQQIEAYVIQRTSAYSRPPK